MPVIERDVVLQGIDKNGNQTMDLPITRLGNIENTADIKNTLEKTDYIPIIDMADNGQMKKAPVLVLQKEISMACQPQSRDVMLIATSWTGSGPYAQTVVVEGVRADEAGQLVQAVPASASRTAWREAGILCIAQGDGTLAFEAQEKPGGNITVYVILQEVGV